MVHVSLYAMYVFLIFYERVYTGSTTGLKDSSCSGLCSAGYHCYEASISPTQLECAVLERKGTFDPSLAIPAKKLQPLVSCFTERLLSILLCM